MKYFLRILFFSVIILGIVGFHIKASNHEQGNQLIGIAVAGLFLVWMPIFLYHRWKGKDVNKYMLPKENIEKMRNHGENQRKNKSKTK